MPFVQTKQREFIRPVWQATITLLVVAMGASAGQPKSFDGAYKGSLECEHGGLAAVQMPLAVSIHDRLVLGGASMLDTDGRHVAPEMGFGTVNPDGVFRLRYIAYMSHYTIEGDYTGTLVAPGGTLTGAQVLTRDMIGDGVTWTCKGTFLQVEVPKR